MRHLGDITKLNGAAVPPVNVIIGGSPCQDLSIAGKRAGLAGERSGLFMEQLRIIKEMRKADADKGRMGKDIRPRFMVWENVPGAFSSNGGEDFGAVLQETIRVICEKAPAVPVPKGGWPTAGCLSGGGLDRQWSVAWRVFDAQFWGVPQRRRRIALVADFGGTTAPEILFERESVSGDFAKNGAARKGVAADAGNGVEADDRTGRIVPALMRIRSGCEGGGKGPLIQYNKSGTLGCGNDQYLFVPQDCLAFHLTQDPISGEVAPCLSGGNPITGQCVCGVVCMATQQGGAEVRTDDTAPTLTAAAGMSGNNQPVICYPDIAHTLSARHDGSPQPDKGNGMNIIVQAAGFKAGNGVNARGIGWEPEKAPTLAAQAGGNSIPSVCVKCYDARGNGDGEIVCTMTGDHARRVSDYTALVCEEYPVFCIQGNCIDRADTAGCNGRGWTEDVSYTLNTIDRPAVAFAIGNGQADNAGLHDVPGALNCMHDQQAALIGYTDVECAAVDCRNGTENSDVNGTLQAKSNGGTSLNLNNIVRVFYIVRRLTPLECERLQGFPDGWTAIGAWIDANGKAHVEANDSARYKALGNSIAIPPWFYVLQRLTLACGADNTMASLFDGIGGFPLIWEALNGSGSCVWGSEIEDFPIAVTKKHFAEVQQ